MHLDWSSNNFVCQSAWCQRAIEVGIRFSLEKTFIIQERRFIIAKTYQTNEGKNFVPSYLAPITNDIVRRTLLIALGNLTRNNVSGILSWVICPNCACNIVLGGKQVCWISTCFLWFGLFFELTVFFNVFLALLYRIVRNVWDVFLEPLTQLLCGF